MNPGPVEEVGKVASGAIDALKAQPVLLALVLFNAAFVALVYYTARDTRMRQGEVVENLLVNQAKMQELLLRCTAPGRSSVEWPDIGGLPPVEEHPPG